MYFIVYFSWPKYHLFIHKEFIQMSDRCFNTLQEQSNKNTHIVYYNFVKMTASPRIRTQGDSIH